MTMELVRNVWNFGSYPVRALRNLKWREGPQVVRLALDNFCASLDVLLWCLVFFKVAAWRSLQTLRDNTHI